MEKKKRLSKALAAAGVASRRAAEEIIFEGRVKVNGETVKVPQTLVDWSSDRILVDESPVNGEERKVYYILNKPHGFVCSNTRIGTKRLVIDLFAHLNLRLFTVGRLDRDTTGLLILTNDGHFANKVIHPSSNISKEYLVKTSQEITDVHLKDISKGSFIEDTWIKPVKVEKVRKGTLKVVVKEGKKREVRLLVQNAGLDILELSRIRIGGLRLGPIPEGTFREMTDSENLPKKLVRTFYFLNLV
ncbi:MAG: rRNA pseudouridine synthase [Candidatus Melainabacteria bacterium]|nr:rRNA pseudouridine synthase [Candidatus Melainabacteria bacterium]